VPPLHDARVAFDEPVGRQVRSRAGVGQRVVLQARDRQPHRLLCGGAAPQGRRRPLACSFQRRAVLLAQPWREVALRGIADRFQSAPSSVQHRLVGKRARRPALLRHAQQLATDTPQNELVPFPTRSLPRPHAPVRCRQPGDCRACSAMAARLGAALQCAGHRHHRHLGYAVHYLQKRRPRRGGSSRPACRPSPPPGRQDPRNLRTEFTDQVLQVVLKPRWAPPQVHSAPPPDAGAGRDRADEPRASTCLHGRASGPGFLGSR
jgi:hypothetical protein